MQKHSDFNERTLFQELAEISDDFGETIDKHRRDNDEILSHVLLSRLADVFMDIYRRARRSEVDSQSLNKVVDMTLSLLERAISSPCEELQDLAAVSFVEPLYYESRQDSDLRARLPASLQKQWDAFDDFYSKR